MEMIARAMKKSLVALQRVQETAVDPSTLNRHAPELMALSDAAIHSIMACADRLIDKIVDEKALQSKRGCRDCGSTWADDATSKACPNCGSRVTLPFKWSDKWKVP